MATPPPSSPTLQLPDPATVKIIPTTSNASRLPSQENREAPPSEICVICLEPVSERSIALPCQHSQFDFICLATWTGHHQVCPLCKAEVTAIECINGDDVDETTIFVFPPPTQDPKAAEPALSTSDSQSRSSNFGSVQSRYRSHYRPRRSGCPSASTSQATTVEDGALAFRRNIYRHNIYSLYIGSNRLSRYRNITPASFQYGPNLTSRAKKFIRRELGVFGFLNADSISPTRTSSRTDFSSTSSTTSILQNQPRRRPLNSEHLLSYIVSILHAIDLKGSTGQAEQLVSEFLGRKNARLFLHELENWLRSPYEHLWEWDANVQYPPRNTDDTTSANSDW